jgi:hypothetical protein
VVTTTQDLPRARCDSARRSQFPRALIERIMRFASHAAGAAVVLGLSLAALAAIATGAQAASGVRLATACSNETVNAGSGNVTVSFVLHGNASCSEAQSTMRAYSRAIADGRCATEICTEVVFAGGWTCSATIPALLTPDGSVWECERSGGSFDVYKASSLKSKPPAPTNVAAWQTIAEQAKFPVYRPTQTLGLKLAGLVLNRYGGCLLAGWGNPPLSSKGPHLGISEPGDTVICGQPGVATPVATAVINGAKLHVFVQCATWPKCTIKDGETTGRFLLFVPERGANHYAIQLDSAHVSLSDFLQVARSFTRVTLPTGPPGARHLTDFLSPDRKIWCLSGGGIRAFPFSCGANPGTFPMFGAYLSNQGKVTICHITHLIQQPGQPPDTCFVNWDDQAPVLQVGQQNYVDGVLCKSATNGITCSLTAGTGKGRGFSINSTSVSRVGPRLSRLA